MAELDHRSLEIQKEIEIYQPKIQATMESKPVPAPISKTFLSLRLNCSWFDSRYWDKASA